MKLLSRPSGGRKIPRAVLLIIILSGLVLGGLLPAFGPLTARAQEGSAAGVPGDLSLDPTPLILEVYSLLRYNSAKEPEPMKLAENAIQGMITGLRDYWAAYYTPEDMTAFTSSVKGAFGGIGVRISEEPDGYLLIADVIKGCPAEKAGILAGDVIIAVDGVDIKGRGLPAADSIRGEPGTKVVITVKRPGVTDPLTFELIRETINVTSVESRPLDSQVGYIAVSGFDQDTDKEFDQALQSLVQGGARGVIIDLRGNPGGILQVCERMVDRFLPERYPYLRLRWTWRTDIVRSRMGDDYTPLEGIEYRSDGRFPYPVAILVNGYSASASEIFAVSLQEWGAARVFGSTTYGKSCVQSIYSLSSGGGVKITTATWTTGLGRQIDGLGVVPDEIIDDPGAPSPPEPGFIPVPSAWVFRRGALGSDVVNLQMRLNQLGYAGGSADGVFASQTEEALKRFQAAVGLPQTGVTDAVTVTALNSARLAEHPAGRKPGTGQAGSGQPGGGQSSLPPAPMVTGDKVIDRAIQWLGAQMTPSSTDGK